MAKNERAELLKELKSESEILFLTILCFGGSNKDVRYLYRKILANGFDAIFTFNQRDDMGIINASNNGVDTCFIISESSN